MLRRFLMKKNMSNSKEKSDYKNAFFPFEIQYIIEHNKRNSFRNAHLFGITCVIELSLIQSMELKIADLVIFSNKSGQHPLNTEHFLKSTCFIWSSTKLVLAETKYWMWNLNFKLEEPWFISILYLGTLSEVILDRIGYIQ